MPGPFDYVSGLGKLPDPAGDLRNAIAFKVGLDQQKLNQRLGELQIEEAQRKAAQRQVFDEDWRNLGANPTPQAISSMVMKHPEMADEIKKGWDIRDDAARRTDLTQIGEIFTLGQKGQWSQAAATARRRYEADKAAGQADPADEQMIEMLDSGDPEKQKAALAVLGTHLAAVTGPEHFGAVFGKVQEGDGFTLAPGSARYNADGNLVAERPFAPRALTVGDGQTVYEYQPGGGGGGGSGRGAGKTGGWAPRASDGGDNPDGAIDNKIGVMGRRLGIGPTEAFGAEQAPAVFDAIAATEGGAGSLADRNNNPGNIRDGAFAKSQPGYAGPGEGGFARFETKDAGRNAGISLVQSKIGNGQNTIKSLIEGLPTGGGGPKVIATGKPKKVQIEATRVVSGQTYVKVQGKWYRKNS